jgi:HEPN domain-containing protein
MNSKELVEYWIKSSDEDYKTMENLYKSKDYTWCLFMGHLVIEKIIKGLYAQNNSSNPYVKRIHSLLVLAKDCNLELTEEQEKHLIVFTRFNISARYEDYKKQFRNMCTR